MLPVRRRPRDTRRPARRFCSFWRPDVAPRQGSRLLDSEGPFAGRRNRERANRGQQECAAGRGEESPVRRAFGEWSEWRDARLGAGRQRQDGLAPLVARRGGPPPPGRLGGRETPPARSAPPPALPEPSAARPPPLPS